MLNQEKIGRFIAERRKEQALTQKQLAEQLNVSDKAVSKWETGRSMPDNAILFDLCKVLDINVNELLSGEKLSDDSYHGKAEENMMTLMKEKQNSGRVNAIVGLILGVLFVLGTAWMTAGNILWYFDMPSLIMIVALLLILLFMCGLSKDFFRGIAFFFGKRKEMEEYERCRTLAAFKLVLIALPIDGLVSSLIALVAVLGLLTDPIALGPNLAVAILTLLYSLILELLLLPVAAKVWAMKKTE